MRQEEPPRLTVLLGYAGLLPAIAAVLAAAAAPAPWPGVAARVGGTYAALILSFLGGLWWALASTDAARAPRWLWIAAVVPSLGVFAVGIPPVIGVAGLRESLAAIGLMLLATLAVDRRLAREGIAPRWWMRLRAPLSIGLGLATLILAALVPAVSPG